MGIIMNKVFKNFDLWLSERDEQKLDTTTGILKQHLGLDVLSDASFLGIQVSDFENYDNFRNKIINWNLFAEMSEINQSSMEELLKNRNARMRDLTAIMARD
jgi:hypothetical protein